MINQALFSLKDKSKKLKCRLLQFLFGALRVKSEYLMIMSNNLFVFFVQNIVLVPQMNCLEEVAQVRGHNMFCLPCD